MNTSQYLLEEIARLERRATLARRVGIVSTLIVVGYLVCGIWMVNIFTDPRQLSDFAINRYQVQSPKLIAAAEMKLAQMAPDVANSLSRSLQEAIPALRMRAQTVVTAIINDKYATAESNILKTLDAYFEAHSADFAPQAPHETIEAYAQRVANTLADKLLYSLSSQLKSTLGSDLQDINTVSKNLLVHINQDTAIMASRPIASLPRDQQLIRLITSHLVRQYLSERPAQ